MFTKTVTVSRLLVTMSRIPHTHTPKRRCATCDRCRRGSAWYDCLCYCKSVSVWLSFAQDW